MVNEFSTPPAPGPLVSVVITCYGQAHFLGEAIGSALAQRGPEVEVIVVDDGSPDATREVAARYPAARYVHQANQGTSAARNAGLRESRGEYVVFLDADDRLLPGALEAALACFAEHPECAFVYGGFRFMAEDGTPREARVRHPLTDDLYGGLLRRNHIEMTSTVLFRRAALERSGGFVTSLRSAEDYELLLRMARTFPAHAHDTLVAEYRRYGEYGRSLSNEPANMLRCTLRVLRAQLPYARGNASYEKQLAAGIYFFENYYGGELIRQIREQLRAHAWLRALRGMAVLVRYYPRGIMERAARYAREVVRLASG